MRPRRVAGDKGYTGRRYRSFCRRRGIQYTIPRQRKERRCGPFDPASYRLRNRVERLFKGRLTESTLYQYRCELKRRLVYCLALEPIQKDGVRLKKRYLQIKEHLFLSLPWKFEVVPGIWTTSQERVPLLK